MFHHLIMNLIDLFLNHQLYFINLYSIILNLQLTIQNISAVFQFKFINIPKFDNSQTNLKNLNISVSLHIRTFDFDNLISENNLNLKYYQEATSIITKNYGAVFYFIFTNNLNPQRVSKDNL